MTTSLPSLNWLRVFEAAARSESFARAATDLHMSAPAVSQQIKALETKLGTDLFIRSAHSVTLTEEGRAYLPAVQHALISLEGATTGLFSKAREEQVFVQSVLIFANGLLVPKLAEFERTNPDIKLRLTTGNVSTDFKQSFSDLMIIFGSPSSHGTESDLLLGETLYPVARPEVVERIKNPQDLLNFPLIEVVTHRASWLQLFEACNIRPTGTEYFYVDNSFVAIGLAQHSDKIALARAPATDLAVKAAGLVPCLPGFTMRGIQSYHIVYEDQTTLRPAAQKFRDWLLDTFAT
jgi:LysR family glycine cleavage system transcriptional activator